MLAARRFLGAAARNPPAIRPLLARRNFAAERALASRAADAPSGAPTTAPSNWEDQLDGDIKNFGELPGELFGVNQHIQISEEFKKSLRTVVRNFRSGVCYSFAYGSGVFPQAASDGRMATEEEFKAVHPNAPASVRKAQSSAPKMIDFILCHSSGLTQHWHDINIRDHRDHYSGLASLGSGAVAYVQDKIGAGVYYNTYAVVNGILIKYGVVNVDTLCRDLAEWDTLYLAGRLHKPVKILSDNPNVRLANQKNLLSALRTALLLLPPKFTEHELYSTISGISYLGDPRMRLPTENPQKVANIVGNNTPHFRNLYAPLIENLPNIQFGDSALKMSEWLANPEANLTLHQDMDPIKRGNMVRRLPKAFRSKLYFQYQKKFAIPRGEFNRMMEESAGEDSSGSFKRQQGGGFEQRIAQDEPEQLRSYVREVIKQTINWSSTTQSLKGVLTAGVSRSLRYVGEKRAKHKAGKLAEAAAAKETKNDDSDEAKST